MIQRIQSVFLLLASLSLAGFSTLPPSKITMSDPLMALAAYISALGALIAFIAIFLYKNRNSQRRVARISMLTILASVVALFLVYEWFTLLVSVGIYFLPLALIFLILAVRFISKDEELIKSMDRLR